MMIEVVQVDDGKQIRAQRVLILGERNGQVQEWHRGPIAGAQDGQETNILEARDSRVAVATRLRGNKRRDAGDMEI